MKTSRSSAYPVVEGVSEKTQSNDGQAAGTVRGNKQNDGTIKPKYVSQCHTIVLVRVTRVECVCFFILKQAC